MQVFVIPLVLVLSGENKVNVPRPDVCKQPLRIGNGAELKYKYFYDPELQECFRYQSKGGDDGLNSFESEDFCSQECVLADKFSCGGNTPSTGSCNASDPIASLNCSAGSFCKKGVFTSMCCSIDLENRFKAEYNPSCSIGYNLVTQKGIFSDVALKGKKCSHNAKCQQGRWIAYCCEKEPKHTRIPDPEPAYQTISHNITVIESVPLSSLQTVIEKVIRNYNNRRQ